MPYLGEPERSKGSEGAILATTRWAPSTATALNSTGCRSPIRLHPVLLRHDRRAKMHRPPAGGTLLQHLKEHRLHCDIRAGDRVFYFTTLGWMMWNWLACARLPRDDDALRRFPRSIPTAPLSSISPTSDRHALRRLGKHIDARSQGPASSRRDP